MTFPEIKLVDSPSASAGVLFDFNADDLPCKRLVLNDDGDPIRFGVPEVQGDPEAVAPLYGNRVVEFQCRLTGTKPNVSAALSSLSRAMLLNYGQVWLSVRLNSASSYYFFKAHRPDPLSLSFENITSTSDAKIENWEVSVSLPCEPFAYGVLETQSTQSVSNNSAASTNPCQIALPAIKGDAPTRLRIQISGASADQVGYRHMFALSGAASPRPAVTTGIGAGDGALASADGDSTTTTNDATYSGGSYRSTTFVNNAGHFQRFLLFTNAVQPGRYRVMVRVARLRSPDARFTISARLADSGGGFLSTAVVTTPAPNSGSGYAATWVDLGPLDYLPRRDPSVTSTNNPYLNFLAGRASAASTGDLRWDAVMLVPMSNTETETSQTLFAAYTGGPYPGSGGASGSAYNMFDGESESFYSGNGLAYCELTGTFPTATPGLAHSLTVLTHVSPPAISPFPADAINTSLQVQVSYYPQYLHPLAQGA